MKLLNIVTASVLLLLSVTAQAEVAVVVHKSNPVELSKGKIKRVFLKKIKSFENGNEIRVANLAEGHPISTEFNNKVLGRSASKLKAYWSKLTFTGGATAPEQLDTSEAILALVAQDQNMIAYIDASKVTDNVRVLAKF